jgi:hypothetical protein
VLLNKKEEEFSFNFIFTVARRLPQRQEGRERGLPFSNSKSMWNLV